MADAIDSAVQYKRAHPKESFAKVANRFEVAPSTLNDRYRQKHASHATNNPRKLSDIQEKLLVDKINMYADRGTHMTPAKIRELGQALHGEPLGERWGSTFVERHHADLNSNFHGYTEAGCQDANASENCSGFLKLLQETYDSKVYRPSCIYSMDECSFDPGAKRLVRRVAGKHRPENAQKSPPTSDHMSVFTCIGTTSAPVPPVVVYQGADLMGTWFAVDKEAEQLSDYDFSYTFILKKWLLEAFDPHTRPAADNGRHRRLLIMDGRESHTMVDFLEACWDRNISVLILPDGLSDKFQPLDVDLFNQLKSRYHQQMDEYSRGSQAKRVAMFWAWHQEAWTKTATDRQIRSAWAKTGLWPLSAEIILGKANDPSTPSPQASQPASPSPRTINTALRNGELDPVVALAQAETALEVAKSEKVLLRKELEEVRAAMAPDQATRGGRAKRARN